jgi:hypothetical protein
MSITALVKSQQQARLSQTQLRSTRMGSSTAASDAARKILYRSNSHIVSSRGGSNSGGSGKEESESFRANQNTKSGESSKHNNNYESQGEGDEEEESMGLSEREIQQLELENADLLRSLESELDDVQKVEQQLSEITSLFDTFTSKVMEQHDQLANILDDVTESRDRIEKVSALLKSNTRLKIVAPILLRTNPFHYSLLLLIKTSG